MARLRLGILGGTFDPPHIAHLVLAERACEQLELDKVLFMPAGDPWRKAARDVSPAADRLEMTRLAIAGREAFELDDREVRRPGPTYTAVTLEELRAQRPDDELYFLCGDDSIADLPNWHQPERIAELAYVVVAPRQGVEVSSDVVPPQRLIELDMPYIGISSTWLREKALRGESLRYLVPEPVLLYIDRHGLYSRV